MSTSITARAAVLVAGMVITALGTAAPASADDQFGQHVRGCAQTMGFNATMNPGMHQGYAGWTPDHTC